MSKTLFHDTGSTVYLIQGEQKFQCPSARFQEYEPEYPLLTTPGAARIWSQDQNTRWLCYLGADPITDPWYSDARFTNYLNNIDAYRTAYQTWQYACIQQGIVTGICTAATWQEADQHILLTDAQATALQPLTHSRGAYRWGYVAGTCVERSLSDMYVFADWQQAFHRQVEADMHTFIDAKYPPRTQQSMQVVPLTLVLKTVYQNHALTEAETQALQACLAAGEWVSIVQATYYAIRTQIAAATDMASLLAITWDFEALFGPTGTILVDPQVKLSNFFGYDFAT